MFSVITLSWSTERNGAWELERRGADGALLRTLTPTALGYRGLLGIDERRAAAWASASSESSQRHVYRVPLDGSPPEPMTTGDTVNMAHVNAQAAMHVLCIRDRTARCSRSCGEKTAAKRACSRPSLKLRPYLLPSS